MTTEHTPDTRVNQSQVIDNSGSHIQQEHNLPVFNDKCRDRTDNTPDPRVVNPAESYTQPQQKSLELNSDSNLDSSLNLDLDILQDERSKSQILDPSELLTVARATTTMGYQEDGAAQPLPISGPLRAIQYHSVRDRASLILQLVKSIPTNDFGLPIFLYRADLLDYRRFQQVPTAEEAYQLQQVLGNSILNLSYTQGFPAFDSGLPIWSQLEWEDRHAYDAFAEYLEQVGIRSLHLLDASASNMIGMVEYHTLNYWAYRAQAFDLYRAAHLQRKRLHRIINAEDSHFNAAEALLAKVNTRISQYTEEEFAELDPKTAADIIDKLVRVQRISLGLPANGAIDESKYTVQRGVTTVELSMRQLSNRGQSIAQDNTADSLDLLRESPDSIDLAQELILKIAQESRK